MGKRGGVVLTPHLNEISKERSQAARLNIIRSQGPTKTCKLMGRMAFCIITLNSNQQCIQYL